MGDRSARFTRHSPGDRWFVDETYVKVTPAEMVTNAAPVYRSAWHHVERHANNPIEADHSQLKHRVRADPARPGIGRSTVTAVPGGWHDHGMDVARRTIVALDFDDAEKAMAIVDRLGDAGRSFKIGLELLTAAGPATVTRLVDAGKDVFLDLKLFEIPPSVAGAVRVAGRLGATMVTVHAMGGPAIMDAAVRAAADFPHLRVIALTVVTSLVDADLAAVGLTATVEEQITRLARLAEQTGCHGVVASPRDAAPLRADLRLDTLIVTPGVTVDTDRTTPARTGHARPAHAVSAVRDGATHVIVGRSVTRAPDPAAVLTHLHSQLANR